MVQAIEVVPSAKRLINSLRDMGYDFSSAIADIVDNSIEAGAKKVEIEIGFYGDDSFVRIFDNGKGMTSEELTEAMRYGSDRDYKDEDLGKFGLGLKTASMSQCQRFSVASTKKPNSSIIPVLCWDLAHIEKTNKWEILRLKDKESINLITAPILKSSGTVILWENLDRIITFKQPDGESARKKLLSMCRELEEYLAMVFHKFLSGEVLGKHLEIYLNKNKIMPWDPFARSETKTIVLAPTKINLIHNDASRILLLQPYILPTKDEFSSSKAFERFSGPAKWNQQQGFYIYRANRMIQSGGWCGLRTRDEHTKLSRVEMNFSPAMDGAFKINVAKMRVQLPNQIKDEIDNVIKPAIALARENYDKEKKSTSKSSMSYTPPETSKSSMSYTPPEDSTIKLINNPKQANTQNKIPMFTFEEIEEKAFEVAISKEKRIITNVFSRLRKKLFRSK